MPAFATHYLFCEEMLELIDTDFELVESACSIGTQGPDIFFFCRFLPVIMPGKPRARVASALHKCKPSALFDAFADYCVFSPNINIAKSYIYGFIMHYALDKSCHPFVYSFQERILRNNKKLHTSAAHNRIEHSMDTYFLHIKKGIDNPSNFDSAATFVADYSVIEEIGHLLAFVIPRVTSEAITEKECCTAIKDTITMQKILCDKSGTTLFVAKSLDLLFGPLMKYYKFSSNINPKDLENASKYANINNKLWFSPYQLDVPRYDSYVDLFNMAKEDCLNLLDGFEQMCKGHSNGLEVTKNISFLTGVEV